MSMHRDATGLKPGDLVDFVRWHLTRNGWEPEIRHVRYLRRDDHTMSGISGGELVVVNRDEWDWAIP